MEWHISFKKIFPQGIAVMVSHWSFLVWALLLLSWINQPGLVAAQGNLPATIEFRYKMPAAGDVTLGWGVNVWQPLPEEQRPMGTTLQENNVMLTPMTREGDEFVVKVQVQPLTVVNYGFLITKTSDGAAIPPVWDGGDEYWLAAPENGQTLSIASKITLPKPGSMTGAPNSKIVTQTIKFVKPEAGEVSLVWGINGWNPAPENMRPDGTWLEKNVLHTPLKKEADTFSTILQLPEGTVVDFGFLTTKDQNGAAINVWEANGNEDYHLTAADGGVFNAGKGSQSQAQMNPSRLALWVGGFLVVGLITIGGAAFLYKRSENKRLETVHPGA